MKKLSIFLLIFAILFSFCSCSSKKEEDATDLPTYEPITESTASVNQTEDDITSSTSATSGDSKETTKATEKTTATTTIKATEVASDVVTYYSENPNNRYIRAISEKYGVDPACLVALIKTNTSKPGATVLQFTGAKDSSGKLIKTADTLKYVYDVPDHGVIKKASGKKTDNDGYTYTESYVNYNLAVKYIIPELDTMKKERTYENYFKD